MRTAALARRRNRRPEGADRLLTAEKAAVDEERNGEIDGGETQVVAERSHDEKDADGHPQQAEEADEPPFTTDRTAANEQEKKLHHVLRQFGQP
jgi:hypothetical protein